MKANIGPLKMHVAMQIKVSSQGHAALGAVPQHTLFHNGVHAVYGCFQHALQRYTLLNPGHLI